MPLLFAPRSRFIAVRPLCTFTNDPGFQKGFWAKSRNVLMLLSSHCTRPLWPAPCWAQLCVTVERGNWRVNPSLCGSGSSSPPGFSLMLVPCLQMPHLCSCLPWPWHLIKKICSLVFITADSTPSPSSLLTSHFQIFSGINSVELWTLVPAADTCPVISWSPHLSS